MTRILILAGALGLGMVAGSAQACDMHGDFGYQMDAYYRGGPEPTAPDEAALEKVKEQAMSDARTAFLNRFAIKVDEPALVVAAVQPEAESRSDADRRPQSQPSDR